MRAALVGCAFFASACGNSSLAPAPVTVAETVPAAPQLTSTVPAPTTTTEPPTTSTTEVVREEAPQPNRTIPESLREQATTTVVRRASQEPTSSGACGGSLPPCYVMQRESRGSLTVYNYEGSGASGKWQIMPGTWNGYGGYSNAADAPESVQDAKARLLWDGGNGCWHWDAC